MLAPNRIIELYVKFNIELASGFFELFSFQRKAGWKRGVGEIGSTSI